MLSPAAFAAFAVLFCISVLPLWLGGVLSGVVLYGAVRSYTLKAEKPQLVRPFLGITEISSLLLGGILLAVGLVGGFAAPQVLHFVWMPWAGGTLALFALGKAVQNQRNGNG